MWWGCNSWCLFPKEVLAATTEKAKRRWLSFSISLLFSFIFQIQSKSSFFHLLKVDWSLALRQDSRKLPLAELFNFRIRSERSPKLKLSWGVQRTWWFYPETKNDFSHQLSKQFDCEVQIRTGVKRIHAGLWGKQFEYK